MKSDVDQYEIDGLLNGGVAGALKSSVALDVDEAEPEVVATPLSQDELAAYMSRRERQRRNQSTMQQFSPKNSSPSSERNESKPAWGSLGAAYNLPPPTAGVRSRGSGQAAAMGSHDLPAIHTPDGRNRSNLNICANVSEDRKLQDGEAQPAAMGGDFFETSDDEDDWDQFETGLFRREDPDQFAASTNSLIPPSEALRHCDLRVEAVNSRDNSATSSADAGPEPAKSRWAQHSFSTACSSIDIEAVVDATGSGNQASHHPGEQSSGGGATPPVESRSMDKTKNFDNQERDFRTIGEKREQLRSPDSTSTGASPSNVPIFFKGTEMTDTESKYGTADRQVQFLEPIRNQGSGSPGGLHFMKADQNGPQCIPLENGGHFLEPDQDEDESTSFKPFSSTVTSFVSGGVSEGVNLWSRSGNEMAPASNNLNWSD